MAKAVSKEAMDAYRIDSNSTLQAAKIGADLVTFGAQLTSDQRQQGIELGQELVQTIRNEELQAKQNAEDHSIQREQMTHEHIQNSADRAHQLEIERIKASAKRTTP